MKCQICLSAAVFPVELKCKHIFCFLCIKGATVVNNKCPLCRAKIHKRYFKRPKFVETKCNTDRPSIAFDFHQWFYEGKRGSGWWCYDDNSCQLLEQAFTSGLKSCELTIAGNQYCVDFANNIQYRCDEPSKKRKVIRELLCNIDVAKGVAGVSKNCVDGVFGQFASQTDSKNLDLITNKRQTKQSIICKNNER